MPQSLNKLLAIVLACLMGVAPLSAAMAAVAHSRADNMMMHDCMHVSQQGADHHCQQHSNGCDTCAACYSAHCSPNLTALVTELLPGSKLTVTYIKPPADEIPHSTLISPLLRPPQA